MNNDSTVFVGLDVHKDSIVAAYAIDMGDVQSMGNVGILERDLDRLCTRMQSKASCVTFVYEAGPCGYGLYRYLTQKGFACMVRIPIKPATDSTLKPATCNAPKSATCNDLKPATQNALKPAGPGALESAATGSGITPRRRLRIGGHGPRRRRDWQTSASLRHPRLARPASRSQG